MEFWRRKGHSALSTAKMEDREEYDAVFEKPKSGSTGTRLTGAVGTAKARTRLSAFLRETPRIARIDLV